MDSFHALAEPTRRTIVELLAKSGQLSASDISKQFDVSSPAISQHLKVLRDAHIVLVQKQAQRRLYSMNPKAMLQLELWAKHMNEMWGHRFDKLDELLKKESST